MSVLDLGHIRLYSQLQIIITTSMDGHSSEDEGSPEFELRRATVYDAVAGEYM